MFYWKRRLWLLKMLSILESGCRVEKRKVGVCVCVFFFLFFCEWRSRFFMGLVGMFYWEFLRIKYGCNVSMKLLHQILTTLNLFTKATICK
jgi:hypothetical protein